MFWDTFQRVSTIWIEPFTFGVRVSCTYQKVSERYSKFALLVQLLARKYLTKKIDRKLNIHLSIIPLWSRHQFLLVCSNTPSAFISLRQYFSSREKVLPLMRCLWFLNAVQKRVQRDHGCSLYKKTAIICERLWLYHLLLEWIIDAVKFTWCKNNPISWL